MSDDIGTFSFANNPYLVFGTYIFALLPWAVLYNHDFISERWKSVEETRRVGWTHFVVLLVPLVLVCIYVVAQFYAEDYKEMATGLVAVIVSLYHLLRTVWGLWQLRWFKRWAVDAHAKVRKIGLEVHYEALGAKYAPENREIRSEDDETGADRMLVNSSLIDNELFEGLSSPAAILVGGSCLRRWRAYAYRKALHLRKEAGEDLIRDGPSDKRTWGQVLKLLLANVLSPCLRPSQEQPCENVRRVSVEAIDYAMTDEGTEFWNYVNSTPDSSYRIFRRDRGRVQSGTGHTRGGGEEKDEADSLHEASFTARRKVSRRVGAHSSLSFVRNPVEYEKGWLRLLPYPKDPEVTWVRWSIAFIAQRCRHLVTEIPRQSLSIEQADRAGLIIGFCILQVSLPLSVWRRFSGWLFEPHFACKVSPEGKAKTECVTRFSLRHAFIESVFEQGEGLPYSFPSPVAMVNNCFSAVDPEQLISESIVSALPRKYTEQQDFLSGTQLEFFALAVSNLGWDVGGTDVNMDILHTNIKKALGFDIEEESINKKLKSLNEAIQEFQGCVPRESRQLDPRDLVQAGEKLSKRYESLAASMKLFELKLSQAQLQGGPAVEDVGWDYNKIVGAIPGEVRHLRKVAGQVFTVRRTRSARILANEIRLTIDYDLEALVTKIDDLTKKLEKSVSQGSNASLRLTRRRSYNGTSSVQAAPNASSVLGNPGMAPSNTVQNRGDVGRGGKSRGHAKRHGMFRSMSGQAGDKQKGSHQDDIPSNRKSKKLTRESALVDNWIALRNGLEYAYLALGEDAESDPSLEKKRHNLHSECVNDLSCTEGLLEFRGDAMQRLGSSLIQFCGLHFTKYGEGNCAGGKYCKGSVPPIPVADVTLPHPGDSIRFPVDDNVQDEICFAARNLSKLDPATTPIYLKLRIMKDIQDFVLEKSAQCGYASFYAIAACILAFPSLVTRDLCRPTVKSKQSRSRGVSTSAFDKFLDLESTRVSQEGRDGRCVALKLEFRAVYAPQPLSLVATFYYSSESNEVDAVLQIHSRDGLRPPFNWQEWKDTFETRCILPRKETLREERNVTDGLCKGVLSTRDPTLIFSSSEATVYEWCAWPGTPTLEIENYESS